MPWLRRSKSAEDVDAWVVQIGTDSEVSSLSIVAVTGTEDEAWGLLSRATAAFPGRTNEVSTFPHHPASGLDGGGGKRLGRDEHRRVFVVEERQVLDGEAFSWFEVFDSRSMALDHQRGLVGPTQWHELTTNTWYGDLGRQIHRD